MNIDYHAFINLILSLDGFGKIRTICSILTDILVERVVDYSSKSGSFAISRMI